ncbi:MAG: Digeranylgeranylglycerophospholipid reductase [Candidatus Heimdallarchaeota archaeon LC_3]|nr:MAG: Digeranylgeranylglycerophospholipid reductase [Candidatus Heimdallarchaeota archaeon LC_3]
MTTTDVLVIGAGPAGSMAALEAVRRNVDVIMLEDHPIVGDPNHCSGLITKKGIDKLNVPYPNSIIDNSISSVSFWSPSNHKFTINRQKKSELLVFQRNNLDRVFASYAELKGVEIRLNSKVTKLIRRNGKISGVRVKEKQNRTYNINSKVVIDAEGSYAKFLPEAGLKPPNSSWRMPAMQYELDNVPDFPREYCELYHGYQWAPGYFAWIIPACQDAVRIGLATWPRFNTSKLLKKFFTKHPIAKKWFKKAIITKKRGGVIAACGPISKTWAKGFLAVGDAAGQVKATTGGGVNIGGYCGRIAGVVAARNITKNMPLENYDRKWKNEFYSELKLMEFIRKTLSGFSDKTLDVLFNSASKSFISKKLQNTKDVDLHGYDLILAAFTPKLIKAGLSTSPDVLINIIKTLSRKNQ